MKKPFSILVLLICMFSFASAQDVYVDNVVILLDGSGSMQKDMRRSKVKKIDAAKSAIKEVMQTIPQSTHVGLIAFGGSANKWLYGLGPRDDAKLFRALDGISANGGTPLGQYMKLAADALLEAKESQYGYGSYRLLVVTDGEAKDAELVNAYTPDIMSRGIIVDAIGVDMSRDHTLATKVNSYRRANDPESLKAAVREVFAEVEKGGKGDSSANAAFEELSGFPDQLAMTMVSTLVSTGNHPIGSTGAVGQKKN